MKFRHLRLDGFGWKAIVAINLLGSGEGELTGIVAADGQGRVRTSL